MATNSNSPIYSNTINGKTEYFYLNGKSYKKVNNLTSDQKNIAIPIQSIVNGTPDYIKNTKNTYEELKNPTSLQQKQAFPVTDLNTFTSTPSIKYVFCEGRYYKVNSNNDFYEKISNPTIDQKSQAIGIINLKNSPGATYLLVNGEYYKKVTKISATRQVAAVDVNNITETQSLDPTSSNFLDMIYFL